MFQNILDFLKKRVNLLIEMKYMNKICFYFLIPIIIFPSIIKADTRITEFHARRENNTVVLQWITEEETDLEKFMIQRSTDIATWTTIGEIKPLSDNSSTKREYSFIDKTIFKINNSTTFYYRIVIINTNGRSTPHDVIVSISGSSGIRHTWGSLKAMFR
jgi:hypothetical protein